MFAIPRLAIVCGLLVFPHGPLNVDRDNSDFPELFRPFKNLLRKIRDLLLTLSPAEFHVLERLLCQLEEPTDLERKLKVTFHKKQCVPIKNHFLMFRYKVQTVFYWDFLQQQQKQLFK